LFFFKIISNLFKHFFPPTNSEVYASFNKIFPLLLKYDRTKARPGAPLPLADHPPPPVLHPRPTPLDE
jgi:hypothetical protein